jgi:membrane protease YdiL (CAAX protease family)
MPSPAWVPFLVFVGLLAVLTVALARESARYIHSGQVPAPPVLYANVVGTQAVILGLLAVAAWFARIPPAVFGAQSARDVVLFGLVSGLLLAAGSAIATRVLARAGVPPTAALREALAPRRPGETVALYGLVLPAVAVGEEALFRGALIGAVLAGVDVSPWVPVLASSALFGYAHSAQGRFGVVATGLLGVALGWAFVLSESLLAVVVAHYVVNAVEFALGSRLTEG